MRSLAGPWAEGTSAFVRRDTGELSLSSWWENRVRRPLFTSWEEIPHQSFPASRVCKVNFCCLSHSNLWCSLWQPKLTKALREKIILNAHFNWKPAICAHYKLNFQLSKWFDISQRWCSFLHLWVSVHSLITLDEILTVRVCMRMCMCGFLSHLPSGRRSLLAQPEQPFLPPFLGGMPFWISVSQSETGFDPVGYVRHVQSHSLPQKWNSRPCLPVARHTVQ